MDRRVTLCLVDAFPEEINMLWDTVSPHFHAIVKRDANYLNWKFVRQPHMNHVRFIARRKGDICGYLILRKCRPPESNAGIIVDIFVPPDAKAVTRTLLANAVKYFRDQNVNYVKVATTVREYQKCLESLGFRKKRNVIPMFLSRVALPGGDQVLEPGSWFLSKGDHDWDQYPLG